MLYNCCHCHPYMYLFHQWHYCWLTFAVSDQRNILKDVTNRNGIKAATIKVFFIPAVLNYARKTWCVQYRKWSRDRKWSPKWTTNDPQPQVILKVDCKWSRKKNRNGLDSSLRIIVSILLLLLQKVTLKAKFCFPNNYINEK